MLSADSDTLMIALTRSC